MRVSVSRAYFAGGRGETPLAIETIEEIATLEPMKPAHSRIAAALPYTLAGAALVVGVRRGGALLGLLILPLYVPVLIFGTAAVNGLTDGTGGVAQVYWLAAISVLAATLTPFAVWSALKISLENG